MGGETSETFTRASGKEMVTMPPVGAVGMGHSGLVETEARVIAFFPGKIKAPLLASSGVAKPVLPVFSLSDFIAF